MSQIIDVKFSISSDAKSITIEDDTSWSESTDKDDVTSVILEITDNKGNSIAYLTDDYTKGAITYPNPSSSETLDEVWTGLTTDYLPDGIYKYELQYISDTVENPFVYIKEDGVFYSTRIVEENINKDLLTFLTGVQAYNYKMDYPLLEEIRRRDNILYAITNAEFLSETDNVINLLDLLKRLE